MWSNLYNIGQKVTKFCKYYTIKYLHRTMWGVKREEIETELASKLVLNSEKMNKSDEDVKKVVSVENVFSFEKFHKKLESNDKTIPVRVSTAKNEINKWVSIKKVVDHMSLVFLLCRAKNYKLI